MLRRTGFAPAAGAPLAAVLAAGAALLLAPVLPARADEPGSVPLRPIEIPGYGMLRVPVPETWAIGRVTTPPAPPEEGADGGAARFVTFLVTPDTPAHCEMSVSFSWSQVPDPAFNGPSTVRALVDRMARASLDDAIESRYALHEMSTPRGGGYWFALRARAPRRKSQAYLTSGAYGVGNALLRFTFLSPQPDLPEAAEAINLIAGARIDDQPEPAPAP